MQTMRNLLSKNPMTFNELLDLFEAYVSSIGGPIKQGHAMLREEIGAGEHVALGHIFGVACDAEDMAKRLEQIRADRNTGTDVTVTLAEGEARMLALALREIGDMVRDAASAFWLLRRKTEGEHMAIASMSYRALSETDDQEGATLRQFVARLCEAGQFQLYQQEEDA